MFTRIKQSNSQTVKQFFVLTLVLTGVWTAWAMLPSAYLEVEYLESTGTQYIDTGVVVETTDDVTAVYKFLTHPNNENWVFASWSGGNNLRCGINSSGYYCGHGDMTVTTDSSTGWSTATRTKYTSTKSGYTDYLYAQHGSGSAPGHLGCSIQIKRYTVTRDSATYCDLVPCMRASDRVCGFYDTVSGDFKTNLGSGDDFTAGPMVAPGTGGILVAGDPYDLGTSTPSYGVQEQAAGASHFSLAGTTVGDETWYLNDAGDRRGKLSGYQLVLDKTNTVSSGAAESFGYTVPATYDALELTWSFDTVQSKVSSSAAGGSVSIGGAAGEKWCAAGETVSLLATADEGFVFYQWTGSGVTTANRRQNPLSITVGADPMSPTPVFAKLLYVATDGDDENGEGTRAKPYATINKALAHATAGSEIRVRGGLYEENVVDSTLDDLTILGGYSGDAWTRDLKNAQTIVRALDASQPVLKFTDEVIGIHLNGLVLCGGTHGVKINHIKNMVFDQLVISNNSTYAIGFGDWALDKEQTMLVANSLIADNTAGIKEETGNAGLSRPWYLHVYGCTYLNNRGEELNMSGRVIYRNNIFVRASGAPVPAQNTGNLLNWFHENCIANFGKTVEEAYPQGLQVSTGNIYDAQAGVMADGSLSSDSPCLKVGGDLSTNELYQVLYDLYGTAWNGEYDMGCIKSDYEPYVPRDLHVATDGDDSTGDGTAAKPYATISKAVSDYKNGDRILVQGGLYEENVENTTVSDITVLGSYDANWKRDLKNARTVIKAADATKPALSIEGVWRNKWGGFDLTGGTYGLLTLDARNHVFEQLVVTNNTKGGVGYGDIGNDAAKGAKGNTLVNALVADNAGSAFDEFRNNWDIRKFWAYNCTFVNNAKGALSHSGGSATGTLVLRNCICYNPSASVEFNGGGNTSLDIGACCIRDALYGSCNKTIQAEPETLTVDPKLDAAYRLTEKSLCNKRGEDLSSLAYSVSTNDLEGASWGSAYDMGCYASEHAWVPGVTRLKDVYVATDGDDEEGDGTEAKPVATLLKGLYLTDAGGTCHIGPGSFKGGVTLERAGMTLVGSGMGVTIVTNGSITIGTHDGTVRDLSVRWIGIDPETGIVISQAGLVTNATVAYCEIANWSRGIEAGDDHEDSSTYQCDTHTYRFSHLVVTNSGVYGGIFVRGNLTIDNCLIATNQSCGLQVYSGQFRAYNCTIADNYGSSSYAMAGPGYSPTVDQIAVNCLFTGSDIAFAQDLGGLAERKIGVFSNCLFNCTHLSYNTRMKCEENIVETNSCLFGQNPQFRTSPRKLYHLGSASPARQRGLVLGPIDAFDPPSTTTLDGKVRGTRFWDMGCYDDPTTGLSVIVR